MTASPNPFSPSKGQTTTISFSLSESATVNVQIVNSSATIVIEGSAKFNAGVSTIVWDGKDATGKVVPAGIYTYKFKATDDAKNISSIAQGTVQVQ